MLKKKNLTNEMLKVLKKNYKRYFDYRGVFYVDIGYKYKKGIKTEEICIRFHVNKKYSKDFLKGKFIPEVIDGYKTDVLISTPNNNQRIGERYNELNGGIEIQNPFLFGSGTLGGIFINENNEIVGLSNYHVLVGKHGRLNDEIIQPKVDNINNDDIIGNLYKWNEKFDCAVFKINNKRLNNVGRIIGYESKITRTRNPILGELVKKSGIATDITFGIIDGINSAEGSFNIVPNIEKQSNSDSLTEHGDSGSLWVLDMDTSCEVIGLHYQGDIDNKRAYAYNIKDVFKQLNINIK
jgi:hypothetical protein